MNHIEKEKLIKADIASIENRVRHAFNQGYDLGFKDGKSKRPNYNKEELIKHIEKVTTHDLGEAFVKNEIIDIIDQYDIAIKALEQELILDKIRAEITGCLKALDDIEKFNIYLPNEMTGRRLTYQQCLGFIDKYKAEIESQERSDKE